MWYKESQQVQKWQGGCGIKVRRLNRSKHVSFLACSVLQFFSIFLFFFYDTNSCLNFNLNPNITHNKLGTPVVWLNFFCISAWWIICFPNCNPPLHPFQNSSPPQPITEIVHTHTYTWQQSCLPDPNWDRQQQNRTLQYLVPP